MTTGNPHLAERKPRVRKWAIMFAGLALVLIAGAAAFVLLVYPAMEEGYQTAQDPVRIQHGDEIIALVLEYIEAVGPPPLHDLVMENDASFRIMIGRNMAEEDGFAAIPDLWPGEFWMNSPELEAALSEGLGRNIVLPRDPQTVATFAPNVYVYFVSKSQFCVAVHLYEPTEISEPYTWAGGTYHSHAICYGDS